MTAPSSRRGRVARNSNLPNGLTLLRLLLVPVFVIALVADDGDGGALRWVAVGVFVVAAVTDFLDGDYARRRGLVTRFGQVADPIADKALTGSAFVVLSWLGELPWWVTVVVLAREAAVTLLRLWVIRRGIIPASRGGKVKTALQLVALLLFLVPGDGAVLDVARVVTMGAAVVVTLVTGIDYAARAVRLHRSGSASAAGAT